MDEGRIIVEFSTQDPVLAGVLRTIAEAPEYSSTRAELEGLLHMYLARTCWRDAERYRALEERRAH